MSKSSDFICHLVISSIGKKDPSRSDKGMTLPSWPGLLNTLTASLQRGKTPSTIFLDMTLNNLMVRFQ